MDRVLHALANANEVSGNADSGSIRFVTKKTCNAMLITFITILSSMDMLSGWKIGRGQPIIDIFEKASILAGLGMISRTNAIKCLFANDTCINKT